MDQLRGAIDFCIRHQTILGYSIVSLLTAASERIFSSVVFKCPCNSRNFLYGSVFLLVPAFILFLLGYMVDTRMWQLLTGSCPPKQRNGKKLRRICTHYYYTVLQVTAKALVAPLTWIAVALLQATFYECAASGSTFMKNLVCKDNGQECNKQLAKIPCDQELLKSVSAEFVSLQAQSQLMGWLLIVIIMTMSLIATCVSRCCFSVSYHQQHFLTLYLQKEEELFEIKAKDHATKLAEINTKCFFEGTELVEVRVLTNEDWQNISPLCILDSEEPYYSRLHKYVNRNRGRSNRFSEGDQRPLGLGFVDEASAGESGF
ncbi:CAHM6 protein, partial [Podilymbus podiceps]|nr:CAHM6 protein [Podilymbus podiceps]